MLEHSSPLPLILGSNSPRRKEILGYFNLPFQIIPSHFNEDSIPFTGNPQNYVECLAKEKAYSLLSQVSQGEKHVILTADTTVYLEERIYGKPQSLEESQQMLAALSGQWHSVFTAVHITDGKNAYTETEESRVLFNSLSTHDIERYTKQFYLFDKAGSYAIQKAGALLVEKIHGCYFNIMGLPINLVQKMLLHFEIDLWDYARES